MGKTPRRQFALKPPGEKGFAESHITDNQMNRRHFLCAVPRGDLFQFVTDFRITVVFQIFPTPFERIRRITGYLVGTLDRFNNGKRAEERDRVKHGVTD